MSPTIWGLDQMADEIERLAGDDRAELLTLQSGMDHMIDMLAQVSDEDGLAAVLDVAAKQFSAWNYRLLQFVARHTELQSYVIDSLPQIPVPMAELLSRRSDLFVDDELSAVLGALQSLQGFFDWAARSTQLQPGPELQEANALTTLVYTDWVKAMLAVSVCLAIARDNVEDWDRRSPGLLALSADRYMSRVEDRFLDRATSEPDEEEETIPADDVLGRLGL